jgi:hypothetical protein
LRLSAVCEAFEILLGSVMDLSEIRETKILKADSTNGGHSTKTLNAYLRAGWILLETYTRDAGDSVPSHFPCFVIGWPKELPPEQPQLKS